MDTETVQGNVRQFKEFLLLYNSISEVCFNRCVTNHNAREIEPSERLCADNCTNKYVHVNHKIMSVYAELQPVYLQRRMDDLMKAAGSVAGNTEAPEVQSVPETTQ